MPTIRLSVKSIARLAAPDPSGKPNIFWDAKLKGFGVLVSGTSDTKTFIVQHALPSGLRRRVTVGRCNILELDDAVERAKKILAEFYSGRDPKFRSRHNPALRTALADYVKARSDLKARSKAFYEFAVNRHLEDWLDKPLRNITREMCEERLHKIADGIATTGKSGHGAANGVMRSLRAIYGFAADRAPADGPFPANPVRLKRVWFKIERRTRMVPFESLPNFYRAVMALPNEVARDYLMLIMLTGLRRREAASLLWADVDFTARIIRVPASYTKNGNKLDLPMSTYVKDLLVKRRSLGDGKFVFPASSKSGHIEEIKSNMKDIAQACGVTVSVHDLRRGFCSIAETTNISPFALKLLVNHSLGNDVTAGYLIIGIERLRESAQTVADRIAELCGIEAVEAENVRRLRN